MPSLSPKDGNLCPVPNSGQSTYQHVINLRVITTVTFSEILATNTTNHIYNKIVSLTYYLSYDVLTF